MQLLESSRLVSGDLWNLPLVDSPLQVELTAGQD